MTIRLGLISFADWISQYSKEKSDRGILARYFPNYHFFSHTNTKEVFIEKMKKNGCSDFLLETFESAWIEFVNQPNAKITIIAKSGYGREYRSRLD